MRKARVGVIGTGWWSTQTHIPSLKGYEKVDLVGLADPDPANLAKAAEYYEVDRTYEDYRDLLSDAQVEGVVIAVPHAYHYEIARDALDSGVHVLVEKPMVLKSAEAWDLVRRAESNGVELMVGYVFHFTRHAAEARRVVQSGMLGDIRFISGLFASQAQFFYGGSPEEMDRVFNFPVVGPGETTYSEPTIAGGGQGQTQITHAMGTVFFVTGLRSTDVFAYMESFDLKVDLVDAVSYRMENGAVGTMGATGSVMPDQPQNQEFIYYGSEGFLRQDIINGKLDYHLNDGTSKVLPYTAEHEIYPRHLTARRLADLVLGEGENLAPGRIGAYTVEFLEAAYRSVKSRQSEKIDASVP